MAARPASFDVLSSVDVPALVVVGDEDVLSPVADAQAMADALPRGRLVVLEGAGHLTAVEVPGAFAVALRSVLDEL
jgi:pimeloyl-ACP methyl ester carboxylesterase